MSSFRNIKITCPDCNTEGTYTVWDSVNVDLDVSDRLTPSINFQYAFLSLPAKRILWYIGH